MSLPVINRVILIVLDSVGIGALPDAEKYGDTGSHTLGHIVEKVAGFALPNLAKMGLWQIDPTIGFLTMELPEGSYGKAIEASQGKDTITGHWEIAGLFVETGFPSYPDGFPSEVMAEFERLIGTSTLGNYAASGTVIIDQLGAEHVKTGFPIVYTSSDSVFQIAMHEAVIPIERQYEICQIARDLLVGEHQIGRVIARPFVGAQGQYQRTANRKDFAVAPPQPTLLNLVEEKGMQVMGVGKIKDIFTGSGITQSKKTKDNMDGVDKTLEFMQEDNAGLIFTNLVDFDTKYGHRRDPEGYAACLEEFDARLPEIWNAMREEDILIITADHGNDPTFPGTDHTREYIPILAYGKTIQAGINFDTRRSFADIGATIGEMLGLAPVSYGESFYSIIKKQSHF